MDALNPDVIVVVDRPIDDRANAAAVVSPRGTFQPDSVGFEAALIDESASSIAKLRASGRKLVIVEPIPIATKQDDPLDCLSSASRAEDCSYQANAESTPLEDFYRSAVVPGAVWSLDLDHLVCPRLPTCDPVVDDTIVKRDSDHITGTYAAHIADRVGAMLRNEHVL